MKLLLFICNLLGGMIGIISRGLKLIFGIPVIYFSFFTIFLSYIIFFTVVFFLLYNQHYIYLLLFLSILLLAHRIVRYIENGF